MRYLLLHIDDAAAEDALSAILVTARERETDPSFDGNADAALAYLGEHIHKIHVGPSGIVPKALS